MTSKKPSRLLVLLLAVVLALTCCPVVQAQETSSSGYRIAGANRYDTALRVADTMMEQLGLEKLDAVIITSGGGFADALAGSYLSAAKNAPILLSYGQTGKYAYLDTNNVNYIKANLKKGGTVYILGGSASVPTSYDSALKDYNVRRLGGLNRFETNRKILHEVGIPQHSDVLVCTGETFADSLSASATGKPILLVQEYNGKLYGLDSDLLAGMRGCSFTIIGGETAVSKKFADALSNYGSVERLSGDTRFETSVKVAEKFFDAPDSMVLAYAWDFPDGLCGGALAHSMNVPLILTMENWENQATRYARSNHIRHAVTLGGTNVLPEQTVANVFSRSDVTLKVAVMQTAYDPEVWHNVACAFTEATGIIVETASSSDIEAIISASMQNGEYPDFVYLPTAMSDGLTEQLIQTNGLHELTNVLSMTIPGERKTVSQKLSPGFTETALTNPYGDGKTYLAPMFYSPCGLFYNAKLFEAKGWTVPTTWDEMWELGDKAAEEGISLFTYPTAGYYDAFLYALIYSVGGSEFFQDIAYYEDGAWESENGQTLLAILDKLADYTHPNTPAQANNQDFTKNQQMVMDDQALFMPNGTWIVGEMADYQATLDAEKFGWGMTALPAIAAGGTGYSYCWCDQSWIPAAAENIAEAEEFMAFLYSDTAAEIFATTGAVQPIKGVSSILEGDNMMFYSIYDNGAKAAMGNFAAYSEIPGVDNSSVFFEPINSLVAGTLTIEEYQANVIAATKQMRANLIN